MRTVSFSALSCLVIISDLDRAKHYLGEGLTRETASTPTTVYDDLGVVKRLFSNADKYFFLFTSYRQRKEQNFLLKKKFLSFKFFSHL